MSGSNLQPQGGGGGGLGPIHGLGGFLDAVGAFLEGLSGSGGKVEDVHTEETEEVKPFEWVGQLMRFRFTGASSKRVAHLKGIQVEAPHEPEAPAGPTAP